MGVIFFCKCGINCRERERERDRESEREWGSISKRGLGTYLWKDR